MIRVDVFGIYHMDLFSFFNKLNGKSFWKPIGFSIVALSLVLSNSSCRLNDNSIKGSLGDGSSSGPSTPTPSVPKALSFTGNSDVSSPVQNRVFDETNSPAWEMTGECDKTTGDVTLSGTGLNGPFVFPCPEAGAFSVVVEHSSGTPSFSAVLGKKELIMSQGSAVVKTQVYKTLSSNPAVFVSSAADLQAMANSAGEDHYILTKDIDFAVEVGRTNNWTPLGSAINQYYMQFHGEGHTISNLHIDLASNNVGLFGFVNIITINDLKLENAYVKGLQKSSILVGDLDIAFTANNVEVSGTVVGTSVVGGLVAGGTCTGGSISNSSFQGSVVGSGNDIGGFVGQCGSISIKNSFSAGAVTSPTGSGVGGLTSGGTASTGAKLENSYSSALVVGATNVGGLIGNVTSNIEVKNSYFIGSVTGTSSTGGIAGLNTGLVANSFRVSDTTCSGCDLFEGTAKTKAELLLPATFVGWDFENESANGTEDHWKVPSSGGAPVASWQTIPPISAYCWSNNRFTDSPFANSTEGATGASEIDSFTVCTPAQLNTIGSNSSYWNKSFKIEASIDMAYLGGGSYNQIADVANYTGIFNGQGHKIFNLDIPSSGNLGVGFIGRLATPGQVKNLGLVNVNVVGDQKVGALVGYAQISTSVTNSFASGRVTGGGVNQIHIGGLVGELSWADIIDSYAHVDVTATAGWRHGGLVGMAEGNITNCYATGEVLSSTFSVGGLVGELGGGRVVTNSFATGDVTGNTAGNNVSLLVGREDSSVITNSYYNSAGTCTNLGGSCTNSGAGDQGNGSQGIGTPGYFFDETNPPMDSWDFTNTWQPIIGGYSVLR